MISDHLNSHNFGIGHIGPKLGSIMVKSESGGNIRGEKVPTRKRVRSDPFKLPGQILQLIKLITRGKIRCESGKYLIEKNVASVISNNCRPVKGACMYLNIFSV